MAVTAPRSSTRLKAKSVAQANKNTIALPEYLHSRHYNMFTPLHETAKPPGRRPNKMLYFYKALEVTDKTGSLDARYSVSPGTSAT